MLRFLKQSNISNKGMNLIEPKVKTLSATFALSWFWFPESQFGCAEGVIRTRVGYTGGTSKNPTYHNLSDHTESIDLEYDPDITSFEKLLQIFWSSHSPTVCHKRQYMSAIFYHNEQQKLIAEQSMKDIQKSYDRPIATKILPLDVFYEAEDYHQKFMLRKHKSLINSLGLNDKQLISSHIAARINGYIGGFGTIQNLNDEVKSLGISAEQAKYILEQIKSGNSGYC